MIPAVLHGEVDELHASKYGAVPSAWSSDHTRVFFQDEYLLGDDILYEVVDGERKVWHGTPIEEREEGREYARPGFRSVRMTSSDNGLLVVTTLYDDTGTPAYLPLEGGELEPVTVSGVAHEGVGELEGLRHLEGDRFAAVYNIDGCSWVYDASFEEQTRTLSLDRVLVGEGSPVHLGTPALILDVELPEGGTVTTPVPPEFQGFAYMLEGEGAFGANLRPARPPQLVLMGPGEEFTVKDAAPRTRYLLMSGQPYGEEPVFNGPFVD